MHTIESIRYFNEENQKHLICWLESPQEKKGTEGNILHIRGWFASKKEHVLSLHIRLNGEDYPVTRYARQDIYEQHPGTIYIEKNGFESFLNLSVFPENLHVEIIVNFKKIGERTAAGITINNHHTPFPTAQHTPVYLVMLSRGRCGSTHICHVLQQHTDIFCQPGYPYEFYGSQYYLQAFDTLNSMPTINDTVITDSFFEHKKQLPAPFFYASYNLGALMWNFDAFTETTRTALARQIVNMYGALDPSGSRYFLEKMKGSACYFETAHHYIEKTKFIFVVRDYRDVYSSILSFNKKRGFYSFGREFFDNNSQFLDFFIQENQQTFERFTHFNSDNKILVKYEDIVSTPQKTFRKIFKFLGLDTNKKLLGSLNHDKDWSNDHKTSQSATASIGRWRKDLPKPVQKKLNNNLKDALAFFDYPTK
ncbi:MAG: sulfotransferase [Rickettsiales bacterium]|nr:sulfotransferase [Rickettsiales bacterium]